MKKVFANFGIAILIFLGCGNNSNDNLELRRPIVDVTVFEKEFENINSIEEQKDYLEQLLRDDQEVRQGQDAEIMLEFGYNSKEHTEYLNKQLQRDAENLAKAELYIEKFGYPNIEELGEVASRAPWLVVHHSMSYETRVKYFPIFYQAYKDGNIGEDLFALYLGRMHRMKYGESLKMENPYRSEDEIKQLIKKLGLRDDMEL